MSSVPVESTEAADTINQPDMGTATLPGRHVLPIADVRQLSQRSDVRGLLRFALHLAYLACTGSLIWAAQGTWYLLVPAMMLHGFGIVTMFAPMHECIHRTAFKTRQLNEIFGWLSGLLCFYNSTYYLRYHTWHHRYTQDAERDPELSTPKPGNFWEYALHISGLPFWSARPRELVMIALGRVQHMPYVPADARRRIAISVTGQLGVYSAAIVGSLAMHSTLLLYYWLLPALLGEPLLRAILIVEHTGCSEDTNGLTNTRTTLTTVLVRLLMWNMPYHAEHHLYPSIPFYQLPAAHRHMRQQLTHIAPSYVAANRSVIHSLGSENAQAAAGA